MKLPAPLLLIAAALTLAGCSRGPTPIRYGQDACAHCRMTLVDQRYGAELVTTKGKLHYFDDLSCLLAYQRKNTATAAGAAAYVTDFTRAGQILPADDAFYLHDPQLRSPMGGSIAAFATEAERNTVREQLGGAGRFLRWPELSRSP